MIKRLLSLKLLRSKSGASLIFVLASMLLLIAIGVSAVTAAGYNHGAGLMQRGWNQLDLYVSSMERTIHSSLMQHITGKSITGVDTLRGSIIRDAYFKKNNQDFDAYSYTKTFDLDIAVPDSLKAVYTARVIVSMNVQIFPPVDEYEWVDWIEGPDGEIIEIEDNVLIGRSPELVQMHGTIRILLNVRDADPLLPDRRLSTATETTYSVVGCIIEEWYYDFREGVNADNMIIADQGTWAVSRHEKTSG